LTVVEALEDWLEFLVVVAVVVTQPGMQFCHILEEFLQIDLVEGW
jgi:hypothetical protein